MNKEQFIEELNKIKACRSAIKWVQDCEGTTDQECWDLCENPRWMFWLIGKYPFNQKTLVKAACKIARLTLKCVPAGESRPLAAIEAAEGWANDNGTTLEQVRTAADAAYAAAYAAYAAHAAYAAYAAAAYATADATADAAYAAADAAYAAADAAYAAAYATADAAYAAADAAHAAADAAHATYAAADAAHAAADAAHATYAESCKIIREYFPDVSKIGKE